MHRMITMHARPRQTDRETDKQTDEYRGNSETIRSITNTSCAKNEQQYTLKLFLKCP